MKSLEEKYKILFYYFNKDYEGFKFQEMVQTAVNIQLHIVNKEAGLEAPDHFFDYYHRKLDRLISEIFGKYEDSFFMMYLNKIQGSFEDCKDLQYILEVALYEFNDMIG